ncbi:glycosyltransferase family 2 protein [Thermodesulfovibrionales bacterium]|nr:glycosyltransferase family 2 protein [Thermodesulfovibrionales bacterium]
MSTRQNNKLTLSVAIITKNEEERLPDCLRSVSFADDIVVVDSKSTDKTVEIAKEFGCRVFVEDWKGCGPQKNSAIDKCKHDWVLVVDADESIPEEAKSEIVRIINATPNSADAYSFPRKNFFHGKWIRHSGWWPDRGIRLFKKSKGRTNNSLVHESIEVNGTIKNLSTPIIHNSIKDLTFVLEKINIYSSLEAENLFRKGKQSSAFKAFFRGIMAFLKLYFLKRGFLDGHEGFVISFSHGVNVCYVISI